MNDVSCFLEEDDDLVPPSGFADRVMEAVSAAAVEPPPLPFPWARLGVVVAAAASWTASGVWLARTSAASEIRSAMSELAVLTPEMDYVAIAVAVTLVAAFATMRMPRDIHSRG